MNLEIRNFGKSMSSPASIIELTVNGWGSQITESVTDLKGFVDISLINNLREIADDLEEQNKLMNEKLNK